MKSHIPLLLPALLFTGCKAVEQNTPPTEHPFTGCWESEDGMSREVWTNDPSGWMFGYSANREEDGSVSFFEQMRLEPRGDDLVFVVIGPKGGTTEFTREKTDNSNEFRFANIEHDYPQIISYTPSQGRLDAYISLENGAERIEFPKRECD